MRKFYPILLTAVLALFCGFSSSAQEEGDTFQPLTQVFEGTLEIDLSAMGAEVTTMENQSLILTLDSETTCTITLCNFSFGEMVLGDIVVDNVAVSADDTNLLFSGAKEGLSLAGGFISADVACEGSMNMKNYYLVMDIDVETMNMKIPVTFSGYPKVPEIGDSVAYTGSITIPAEGDPVVLDNQTVTLTPTGENTCIFSLYNFNFGGIPMGDIVIEDVEITKDEEDNIIYTGLKEGLSLAGGMIVADVSCSGVENADGNLTMNIMVTLAGTDTIIPVVFNGQRSTDAIDSVVNETVDCPIEYYRLNGVKVNSESLNPGLYIVKQGNKSYKTIIR